ncbi:MAG: DUF411 domain-containing protein [Chromatiales bacterium]|nr:MAG: DUF411 domain-containing protein [Chromatiales bacterium]
MRNLTAFMTVCLATLALSGAAVAADLPKVTVYKSPTCGCCVKWADQLRASGFEVETINVRDVVPIKQRYRVPPQLGSCHTAVVDDYVVEGHVPIEDILRLLRERPDKKGIAVPGMPVGSPGMEGPNPQAFKVYAFDSSGAIEEYAAHSP